MDRRTTWEISVLVSAVLLCLIAVAPAAQYARREARDGERREGAALAKRHLERYNNEHEQYPLTLPGGSRQYVVLTEHDGGAEAWYIRTPLENAAPNFSGYDFESGRNYYYRIVNENGHTFYDVCGGTALCGADPVQK